MSSAEPHADRQVINMKVELQHSRGGFFNQNFLSSIKTQDQLHSVPSQRATTQPSKRASTTAGGRRR